MAPNGARPPIQSLGESIKARMAGAGGIGYGLGISIPGDRATVFAGETVAGSGRPIGPASRFPIACLMKLLTSIRCLQLVEAGRLDLDDPICAHAPELSSGAPERDDIRIRHLLSHTGGYVEPGLQHRWNLSWETFRDLFVGRRQAFRPGEVFSYTQTGHSILAHIIEGLDGVSIFQSVEDHILGPLGVSGSWQDGRSADDVALHLQARAGLTPFQPRSDTGILRASIGDRRLTVEDLLVIGEGLVGRSDAGETVISPWVKAALFGETIAIPIQTPRVGTEDIPVAYGLGLGRYSVGFGQNGSYVGTSIGLRVCPETRAVAVAALNAWFPLIRDNLVISALSPLTGPPLRPERDLTEFRQDELAGRYQGLMFGSGDIQISEDGEIVQYAGTPAQGRILAQADGGVSMVNSLNWASLAAFREAETGEAALVSVMCAFRKYPSAFAET